jgi:hypothetical protein
MIHLMLRGSRLGKPGLPSIRPQLEDDAYMVSRP